MDLSPLINASFAVQVHVAAIAVAVAATALVAVWTKGSPAHRWFGRAFVAGMAVAAVSSFWIRELNAGSLSSIHVLSVTTLIGLAYGIGAVRQGRVRSHRLAMILTAVSGLGIAGAFAVLAPGRLMWRVFLG
ncbi:MAG: DUF2306 domain-containing protein [Hyphomicrobiales bacterium]